MKYNQPFDQPASPNASFVDGNPSAGVQGSIPPAAAIEYPQREIVQAIADVGLAAPSNSDLTQLSAALRFMRLQTVTDVGASNQISVTLSPGPAAWAQPLAFVVKIGAGNTNTSSTVTVAIAGLAGSKNVVKADGSAPAVGDFPAGKLLLMVYDGSALRCMTVLASDLGSTINNTFNFSISYGVDTSGTPNAIVAASMSPALTALATSDFVVVKVANANTGPVTAQLGSTAAKPVVANDGLGSSLEPNVFPAGGCNAFMVYDGTVGSGSWVLLNVSAAQQIAPATAPFFPEILTPGGFFTLSASGGTVSIAAGQSWQWRGLRSFTTASPYFSSGALQFTTAASKTYHLRWDAPGTGRATPAATFPYGRFYLADLADTSVYNPSSLAENNGGFDSTYDSMLIARVVTNGANVATVTALINRARLFTAFNWLSSNWSIFTVLTANHLQAAIAFTGVNWSRAPQGTPITGAVQWLQNTDSTQETVSGWANLVTGIAADRYGIAFNISTDFNDVDTLNSSQSSIETQGYLYAYA